MRFNKYSSFVLLISTIFCLLHVGQLKAESMVPVTVNRLSLDFEGLKDRMVITDQFANIGVSFVGATILGQGESLNYLGFPPHSGVNVIYDDPTNSGLITVNFDQNLASNAILVGAYVTGNRNITMTAYDSDNNTINSISTGGANYAPDGTPNKLLEIVSDRPIKKVTFFNGGERGNTFTIDDFYFNSGLNCQNNNIPLYKQGGSAEWADDLYGGSEANPWYDDEGNLGKMRKYGCAVTSASMVVSYYGLIQNRPTTTPRELNNWLRTKKGYSGGAILWPKVAEFARDKKGIQLYYYEGWGPDEGIVNAYVCNSSPIILNTKSSPYTNGHFVVATGILDNTSWNINDPGGHNLSGLGTSAYVGYRKYSSVPKEPKHLTIAIHPPVTHQIATANVAQASDISAPISILVVDPAGRRTIYDGVTGHYENEILDANFQVETLGERDGTDLSIETYVFGTGTPLDGEYIVEIYSTVEGSHTIDLLSYDVNGNASVASTGGEFLSGAKIQLNIDYSSEPGSVLAVDTHVVYDGDCNGDQSITASDVTALALEFFDGDDNSNPFGSSGGTYAGSPACDANEDSRIGASDVTCIARLFFNGPGACRTAVATASAVNPSLAMPQQIPATARGQVTVPITLNSHGVAVGSLLFSIDYDETWLQFDPTDGDGNGIPDAITAALPTEFVHAVTFDPTDTDGELDFVVSNFAATPLALTDGPLLTVTFQVGQPPNDTEAAIRFAQAPGAAFGTPQGQELAGDSVDGAVSIILSPETPTVKSFTYLPLITHTP